MDFLGFWRTIKKQKLKHDPRKHKYPNSNFLEPLQKNQNFIEEEAVMMPRHTPKRDLLKKNSLGTK